MSGATTTPISTAARRASLVSYADDCRREADDLLAHGLDELAGELIEEALHARLAALSLEVAA